VRERGPENCFWCQSGHIIPTKYEIYVPEQPKTQTSLSLHISILNKYLDFEMIIPKNTNVAWSHIWWTFVCDKDDFTLLFLHYIIPARIQSLSPDLHVFPMNPQRRNSFLQRTWTVIYFQFWTYFYKGLWKRRNSDSHPSKCICYARQLTAFNQHWRAQAQLTPFSSYLKGATPAHALQLS
jgi:hypothetical protein